MTKYDIQGSQMYIDEKDSLELAKNGIYDPQETELIKKLVTSEHVVLDIGANIGYFTLLMAKQTKAVFAFEPDPDNFMILEKNIKLNKAKNVELFNMAVGEFNGFVDLHRCDFNNGMHRVYESKWCKDQTIEVPIVKIDSLIDHADFVKMDIEGSEFGALKGMERIIKESRPTLLLEFHPPGIKEYGANPREMYNFIRDLRYEITLTGIHGYQDIPDISCDQLVIETDNYAGRNILCTPREKLK